MGLAASQARFLGITARKSNIEYEGQQVNQQRMALAEEVNSLYSQLLSLKVPVAPDTTSFYETNYSFELDNTEGYDGKYLVKSYYQNDDGTYYINAERTYNKNIAVGTVLANSSILKSEGTPAQYTLKTTDNPEGYSLTRAENSQNMIDLINSTYGSETVTDDSLYFYKDADGLTHYIPASQVEQYNENTKINSYISSNTEVTETTIFENATVVFDANNRFKSIYATDPQTGEKIFDATDVDTTRIYDTEGYDAALRDYTMSKDEYDKEVADINAQTESLQQEDKVLELRLNQIDTEQNELKTELDAIKEVLKNNIENTFKTFS